MNQHFNETERYANGSLKKVLYSAVLYFVNVQVHLSLRANDHSVSASGTRI